MSDLIWYKEILHTQICGTLIRVVGHYQSIAIQLDKGDVLKLYLVCKKKISNMYIVTIIKCMQIK